MKKLLYIFLFWSILPLTTIAQDPIDLPYLENIKIDGDISDWVQQPYFNFALPGEFILTDYTGAYAGATDGQANIRLGYDNDALLVYWIWGDDQSYHSSSPEGNLLGDLFQVNLKKEGTEVKLGFNVGNNNQPVVHDLLNGQNIASQIAFNRIAADQKLWCEVAIPWSLVFEAFPNEGFDLNIGVWDSDRGDFLNEHVFEWAAGISDPSQAAYYPITVKKKDQPNEPVGEEKVYQPKFEQQDLVIARINAKERGAQGDGFTDDQPVLQRLIDEMHTHGGGVIYMPAGVYQLNKQLVLKSGVTLRGDWQNPLENGADQGTLLSIRWGKNTEGHPDGDDAAILMDRSTGLIDLGIWYPEQSFKNPVPYPWTIRQHFMNNATLENVTLVNVWKGIKLGPRPNQFLTLKDVYITPLKMGLERDQTYDCARMQNIVISPTVWEHSKLSGAPKSSTDQNNLREYMRNNTIGADIRHYAWTWMFNWVVEGCKIGVRTARSYIKHENKGPNGGFYKLQLIDNMIGMQIGDNNYQGWFVTDAEISSKYENSIGIATASDFETVTQLSNLSFFGNLKYGIKTNGAQGTLSLINSHFDLSQQAAYDIYGQAGHLSMISCTFEKAKNNLYLGDELQSVQVMGLAENIDIKDQTTNNVQPQIALGVFDAEELDAGIYQYHDQKYRPAKMDLFNVLAYGAVGDGEFDNTLAFTRALDAAKQNGGGTVFVPVGQYLLNGQIRVPTGVELRGVFDVPHHTLDINGGKPMKGSELYTIHGHGDERAGAFIELEANSAVRGFTIWHRDQVWNDGVFTPYPYAIANLGPDVWIKDITLVNAYNGVDLGSYESTGHHVDFLAGCVLRRGLYVDNNFGDGFVKNVHFIGHYWSNSEYPNRPQNWEQDRDAIIQSLEAFIFGYTENEQTLHTFVFGSKIGQRFITGKPTGKGASGTFVAHGTDESETSLYFDNIGDATFINYQLVAMSSPNPCHYMVMGPNVEGKAKFFNTLMWGYKPGPAIGIDMQSGDFTFQQINFTTHSTNDDYGVKQTGGKLKMTAPRFRLKKGANIFGVPDTAGKYLYFGPDIEGAEINGVIKRVPQPDGTVITDDSNGKVVWDKVEQTNPPQPPLAADRGVIRLFPNPVEDFLQLTYTSTKSLENFVIFNNEGRQMTNCYRIGNGIMVDSLPSGIYFLRLFSEQGSRDYKFLKQ
ncbi:glycosyl hydrolase family 28-related protein [Persicobacter diffluens]|uniref:Rhamnogalacturonase A/B/Epimerase-like pectate lyase domain-containing protein n=1 Tax=Persicobacter diffluens TaxID=981 RepID=A0AAN4W2C7_9BACT|nr:hypothetical protein PEDI_46250 [Persicobacter diffluens]